MLKITTTGAGGVELTGRLVAGWVDEFAKVVEGEDGSALRVDLRQVTYADLRGIMLLRRLASSGVVLTNASAFLESLVWGENDDRSC